jgi:hypothetical protein
MKEKPPRPGKYVDTDKAFVVHPDVIDAHLNYTGDNSSFSDIFNERKKTRADGEPYWNTDHDAEMKLTAEERTLVAAALGWRFKRK